MVHSAFRLGAGGFRQRRKLPSSVLDRAGPALSAARYSFGYQAARTCRFTPQPRLAGGGRIGLSRIERPLDRNRATTALVALHSSRPATSVPEEQSEGECRAEEVSSAFCDGDGPSPPLLKIFLAVDCGDRRWSDLRLE